MARLNESLLDGVTGVGYHPTVLAVLGLGNHHSDGLTDEQVDLCQRAAYGDDVPFVDFSETLVVLVSSLRSSGFIPVGSDVFLVSASDVVKADENIDLEDTRTFESPLVSDEPAQSPSHFLCVGNRGDFPRGLRVSRFLKTVNRPSLFQSLMAMDIPRPVMRALVGVSAVLLVGLLVFASWSSGGLFSRPEPVRSSSGMLTSKSSSSVSGSLRSSSRSSSRSSKASSSSASSSRANRSSPSSVVSNGSAPSSPSSTVPELGSSGSSSGGGSAVAPAQQSTVSGDVVSTGATSGSSVAQSASVVSPASSSTATSSSSSEPSSSEASVVDEPTVTESAAVSSTDTSPADSSAPSSEPVVEVPITVEAVGSLVTTPTSDTAPSSDQSTPVVSDSPVVSE